MQSVSAPIRLEALTTLRFFAAAFIVFGHSQGQFGIPVGAAGHFNASHSVAFFFVLSGFILAWVYPTLEKTGGKSFLIARLARIWPAHITTLALICILLTPKMRLLGETTTLGMLIANILMVHAWIPYQSIAYRLNSVSWSISTEAFFYLCFPLLIKQWRRTWWLKLLLSATLTLTMIILCNVIPIPDGIEPLQKGVSAHAMLYNHPFTRQLEFVFGMSMASLFRFLQPRMKLRMLSGTLLELAALALIATIMFYYAEITATAVAKYPSIGGPGSLWMNACGVVMPFFGIFIVVMGLNLGWITRILSLPFLVLLGEISYSIYLMHFGLLHYYCNHKEAFVWIPMWLQGVTFGLIVLISSYVMWRYIEKPCRGWIRKLGA